MSRALMVLQAAAVVLALASVAVADDHVQLLTSGPPVSAPTADVHDGPAPLRVCFDASKSYHPEGRAFVFWWDFGDGRGNASEPSACHVYIEPGLYAAMLTVTDDRGLASSRVLIVSVREEL